jgi:hypothetical protein
MENRQSSAGAAAEGGRLGFGHLCVCTRSRDEHPPRWLSTKFNGGVLDFRSPFAASDD